MKTKQTLFMLLATDISLFYYGSHTPFIKISLNRPHIRLYNIISGNISSTVRRH